MAAILLVVCSYTAGQSEVQAKTENENYISYLGADWGPDGDTIYFLKQVVLKQKTTGAPFGLTGGVQTRGSGIWFCKMKWDGSQKQEIAEMWHGQDAYVDTQGGPVWMEVNAATSNVAFGVEYGMGTVGIWVMGLDGKNLHRPFEPVWNDKEKERVLHPSWSPDGSQIVYCKDSRQLGIFDFKTQKRTKLTDGPRDEHPTWSPKGDWIAFTHNRYDNADKAYTDRRIWLIRPDGSKQEPVVDEKNQPIFGWWPSWSPDGQHVGIANGFLAIGSVTTNQFAYVNPMPILNELLPYTFMAHHWGKRGWLLTGSRSIRLIDSKAVRGRLLAAGAIYDASSKDSRWGIPPEDIPGRTKE